MQDIEKVLLHLQASIEIIAEQAGLKNRIQNLLPEKLKEIQSRQVIEAKPEPKPKAKKKADESEAA